MTGVQTCALPICSKDNFPREIKIENQENHIFKSFISEGCKFKSTSNFVSGKYQMTVLVSGYDPQIIGFEILENQTQINLLPVVLKEKTNSLQEVTIYGAQKKYLKIESDKTTINIKENAMLNSGSSFDAVKKLPGVITSPTGSLTLNGKNVKIYIDGAPSSLSGSDLQNYLSGLPANAIEKIELIYSPGASFDANSSGSVINIVTNSKRLKGVNASFNINYNFNKYQKPSPQVLLNGKEKSFSWQTMLGYNYIDGESLVENHQTFTSFDPQKNLYQSNYRLTTQRNAYFRVGTNFKLSAKSNLLINYNGNLGNDRETATNATFGDAIVYNDQGVSRNKNSNHEFSLQFKTKLDTLGKTFDIIAFSNLYYKNPKSKLVGFSQNTGNSFNNGSIDFGLENHYLKYDFEIPLKKFDFSLTTGGKYNLIKVKDFGKYNYNSGDIAIFNSNLYAQTTDFDYRQNNLAFYVEARKKIKNINITAGIRFEDYGIERRATILANKIEYKNTNFFPNFSALYQVNSDINISASYSKKISQPEYNTIDPNNSSTFNQYNTSAGNLTLQPVFYNNYELKTTAFQYVSLGINYTQAKNESRFIFNANPGELVSNSSFEAFDKIKTFSAYVSFPLPLDYFFKSKEEFKKRMNTIEKMNYIFININYVKSITVGNTFPFSNKPITNYSLQSQIILPWSITNSMNYFILPKGTWEIYQIQKPIQEFDISFNRDFSNKKLKIGLHCFDVFNQNEVNALISGRNLNSNFHQKNDSRTFRMSLTYNFGNLKLQKENTNIETEKTKQGGGMIK